MILDMPDGRQVLFTQEHLNAAPPHLERELRQSIQNWNRVTIDADLDGTETDDALLELTATRIRETMRMIYSLTEDAI